MVPRFRPLFAEHNPVDAKKRLQQTVLQLSISGAVQRVAENGTV